MATKNILYFIGGYGCFDSGSVHVDKFFKRTKPDLKIKYKCHNTSSAFKTIISTYIRNVCHSNYNRLYTSRFVISIVEEILSDLSEGHTVLVYGFSFGGAITNTIAEIILQRQSEISDITKLQIATFGSIYISKMTFPFTVKNYMSITDPALKCHSYPKKTLNDLPLYLSISNIRIQPDTIICQLEKPSNTSEIIYICLYKNLRPICNEYLHSSSVAHFNEHNHYWYLMRFLVEDFDVDVYSFKYMSHLFKYDDNHKLVNTLPRRHSNGTNSRAIKNGGDSGFGIFKRTNNRKKRKYNKNKKNTQKKIRKYKR